MTVHGWWWGLPEGKQDQEEVGLPPMEGGNFHKSLSLPCLKKQTNLFMSPSLPETLRCKLQRKDWFGIKLTGDGTGALGARVGWGWGTGCGIYTGVGQWLVSGHFVFPFPSFCPRYNVCHYQPTSNKWRSSVGISNCHHCLKERLKEWSMDWQTPRSTYRQRYTYYPEETTKKKNLMKSAF